MNQQWKYYYFWHILHNLTHFVQTIMEFSPNFILIIGGFFLCWPSSNIFSETFCLSIIFLIFYFLKDFTRGNVLFWKMIGSLLFRDLILQCLDDRDESIRYRALDLVVGMISKKTLVDIIKKLMYHMDKAEGSAYRDELLAKIIQICSQSNYQFITNFEWYNVSLLFLSSMFGAK